MPSAPACVSAAPRGRVPAWQAGAAALLLCAAAVQAQGTAAEEAEFWRSAERIGTADAFRAYLKAYPQGLHADLARAALQAPATQATAAKPPAVDAARLLADAPASGAVSQLPGEVYIGPGPMTVGYLGAKKQLVLPGGRWLLLAVGDRPSGHTTPVLLATMVFGDVEGGQLHRLLVYVFNGRPGPVRNNWPEVEQCDSQGGPRGSVKAVNVDGPRRGCGWSVGQSRLPELHDPAWDRALSALTRLGVAMPSTPITYTRAWASDASADFLSLRRLDFDAAPRKNWLDSYLPLMMDGFQKRLRAAELDPGKPPAGAPLALPD